MIDINHLRQEYTLKALDIDNVLNDPLAQFKVWFEETLNAALPEPNAMHLCTVSAEGKPSSRIVLLKEVNKEGFVFFTNYESKKGKELAHNPYAALTFFWAELERQVRIEGIVQKIAEKDSEIYFHSRPRGSQLGAWASPQSQEIAERAILEEKLLLLEKQYANQEVPLPSYWGGYVVIPYWVEFWQGRPNRLHDRIIFVKEGENWTKKRLAP